MQLGIWGAGLIARAVATLAMRHGHEVMVSNSRGPQTLSDVADELGCCTGTVDECADFGDLILVAVPFKAHTALPPERVQGKIVLDACNHYPLRDGEDAALDAMAITSGERLSAHLHGARVVKAFNAILQRDIVAHAQPATSTERRALPIAGDDSEARSAVASLIDQLGFDVVDVGLMAQSWRFERGMPAYCIPMRSASLTQALSNAERGQRLPEGSWRTPRPLA